MIEIILYVMCIFICKQNNRLYHIDVKKKCNFSKFLTGYRSGIKLKCSFSFNIK